MQTGTMLLTTLLPLLAALTVGYLWTKSGRPFENTTLTPLVGDIAMPTLIFTALMKSGIPPAAVLRTGFAALVCLSSLALIGTVLITIYGLRLRTYLPSVTWGNAGFLGIPLAFYAFGQEGLGHAAAFSAASLVFNSIFCPIIASGQASLGTIVRNPLLYAVGLGLSLQVLHVNLPSSILRSVAMFGDMAIPLSLMMVGATVARLKAIAVRRSLIFSMLRTCIGAGVGMVIGKAFGLNEIATFVLTLQCAMPVAVLSYILSEKYNNEPNEVAGLVVVSTWAASISVPIMLSFMGVS